MAAIIKEITFEDILFLWKQKLWPDRISKIESHSAMIFNSDKYSMENFNLPVWYLGCFVDGKLVGANSGHMCADGSFRSRGLWVDNRYRKLGLGKNLLSATIEKSLDQRASFTWSFPRLTSWKTYQSVGFELVNSWQKSESSDANAFAILK